MPREGKTLLMTRYLQILTEATKTPIYSNYPLKFATSFRSFLEICEKDHVTIAWDEIHASMDSRGFKEAASRVYTHWLTIISHFSTNLFYTSQFLHLVDRRLRDLTDYMFFCSGGRTTDTIRATVVYWPQGKIVGRVTFGPKQSVYPLYDSFAIIKPTLMPSLIKKS